MTDEILSMGTGEHHFKPGKRQDTYYDSHAILFLYLRNGNEEMLPVASDMGSVGERINQERGRLKAGRIREKGGLVQKTDL